MIPSSRTQYSLSPASTGEPAGFATALLTVALPVPVIGRLVARPEGGHLYDLRLANDSRHPTGVRIKGELDPPAGSVSVEPEAVLLEPGGAGVALDDLVQTLAGEAGAAVVDEQA